jgi:hypothetical protein
LLAAVSLWPGRAAAAPRLKVSENKRFLVYADGRPFFWLGDTAWELFHRLNREEADRYLENRARKGFTVIQAVAIGELDGHAGANAYGHLPLEDLDPAHPATKDGPANDYWDQVDYVVNKAESLGMFIGLLPTWGRYWHDRIKDNQPIFTPQNAAVYGEWLGRRYKDKAVIWILGGDRPIDSPQQLETIRAMARGLRLGGSRRRPVDCVPPRTISFATECCWPTTAHWTESIIFRRPPWMNCERNRPARRRSTTAWGIICATGCPATTAPWAPICR